VSARVVRRGGGGGRGGEGGPAHARLPAASLTPRAPPALRLPPCRARAVDTLCRKQFHGLAACLAGDASKGDATKCMPALTAFDVCTEDF
jgi:hypothetical protein